METILFIEDDQAVRKNLGKLLSLNNYYPILAENGIMGLELADKLLPDLIICDIMLPDIDGYTILDKLSKSDKTNTIPFIFLTARAEMESLRKGMTMGADDYLLKPLKTNEILKVIRKRLDKKILLSSKTVEAHENTSQNLSPEDSILITVESKVRSIKLKDIVCITSAGVYTYLHDVELKKCLIRKIIKEWMEILPPSQFMRIHRNAIINLSHIKNIDKCQNGTFTIYMNKYEDSLPSSHKYSGAIRKKLFR